MIENNLETEQTPTCEDIKAQDVSLEDIQATVSLKNIKAGDACM